MKEKIFYPSMLIMFTFIFAYVAFADTWIQDQTGWWYQEEDESYPIDEWEQINGDWYYFDSMGYLYTDRWVQDNGAWYYMDVDGRMVNDRWVGNYYLGTNGAMLTDTVTPDGYYVGSDGRWIETTAYRTVIPLNDKEIVDYLKSNTITYYRDDVVTGYSTVPIYNGFMAELFTSSSFAEDLGDCYCVPNIMIYSFQQSSDTGKYMLGGPFNLYIKKDAMAIVNGWQLQTAEELYQSGIFFEGYKDTGYTFCSFGEYLEFDPEGFVTLFTAYVGD